MVEIQRWKPTIVREALTLEAMPWLDPDEDGEFVTYADHIAALAALEQENAKLREALKWVARRYKQTLAGKSVGDADEALHRADLLLEIQ
jgi:GAF domain-containing protein